MPYADNQGTRIYYEVEGEGPPLLLVHGRPGSVVGTWRQKGYNYAAMLKDDHRLILVELRGFGHSDKPHDPEAYRKAFWVTDIVAVLDDLAINRSHYLGYSMGGLVGYCMAMYAPERLRSLIIGGMDPHEPDPAGPNPREPRIQLLNQGMDAWVAASKQSVGPWWSPGLESMFRGSDLDALIAQYTLRERVGLVDALPGLTVPCLIFCGEADRHHTEAKKASELIPNASFVSLPGLGHLDAFGRADLALPHIRKFLAELGNG